MPALKAQTHYTYSYSFAFKTLTFLARWITALCCYCLPTKIIPPPCTQGIQPKHASSTTIRRYLLAKVRKSRDNTKQNANKCWLLFLGMSKNSSNFAFRQTTTFTWIATKICQKTLAFFMYNPLNIKKMIQEKKKYESQLRLLKVMWEKT